MDRNNPIGVFDSGIGGLTVLDALHRLMPNENFIYLADDAYFPYGRKSGEEIENRILQIGKQFQKRDVKALVIACNTASANSHLLRSWSKIPVQSVIEPTALFACKQSRSKRIAILATDLTIKTGTYQNILKRFGAEVFPLPGSGLVELAENPNRKSREIALLVREIISPLQGADFDTIVLGCTHFGLLSEAIGEVFPKALQVGCGEPTANQLREILASQNLLADRLENGKIELYASGNPSAYAGKTDWLSFPFSGPNKW
ncbi:MAG TPA: glutamate racemase [Acholeplasmatales bacterium]|nr:glutamate racemase [Acholeplasmatales bacterium]